MGTCVHSVDVRHLKVLKCNWMPGCRKASECCTDASDSSARQHNFQVSSVAELVVERTFTCTAVTEGERWMWM